MQERQSSGRGPAQEEHESWHWKHSPGEFSSRSCPGEWHQPHPLLELSRQLVQSGWHATLKVDATFTGSSGLLVKEARGAASVEQRIVRELFSSEEVFVEMELPDFAVEAIADHDARDIHDTERD